MKIYFAVSSQNFRKNLKTYQKIYEVLERHNVQFLNNYAIRLIKAKVRESNPIVDVKSEKVLMLQADLVLIEASTPSFGLGALFGLAAMHKKQILCIHNLASQNEISDAIASYNSALVKSFEYTLSNLEVKLNRYFKENQPSALTKFNFIVNHEVMNFIEEGAVKSGKSKSEFLRDIISESFIKS